MAWKKRTSDDGASGSPGCIAIFTSGSGMLVEGSPTAVSEFVDQMLEATKEVGGRSRHFESLSKVGGTIADAARTTTRAIAANSSRIRNRKDDDNGDEPSAELTP